MSLPRLLVLTATLGALAGAAEFPTVAAGNVVVTQPGKDASDAMPLGNGSLGASAWMDQDRSLVLYLNHTDTFSEASRLLKIGRVRVQLNPVPTGDFRQVLRVDEGRFDVTIGDTRLEVLVEPGRPVIRVLGHFAVPTTVTVTDEGWRRTRMILAGAPGAGEFTMNTSALGSSWTMDNAPAGVEVAESADVPLADAEAGRAIGWVHRNADSVVALTLKHQSCDTLPGSFDPLRGRTFGAVIDGPGLVRREARVLASATPGQDLDLRLTCPVLMTANASAWVAAATKIAATAPAPAQARSATTASWSAFWDRSWIHVDGEGRHDIPDNGHPLRIGIDSEGANRFPGEFAQVVVLKRAASASEIAALAATARDQAPADLTEEALRLPTATPGTVRQELTAFPFAQGLTFSAWIRPNAAEAGRIVDRMTANGNDGVLFDTWPGDALRLIVGTRTLHVPKVLTAGTWQHVAATFDPATGAAALWLNGRRIDQSPVTEDQPLTRAYQRQRYLNACQNRGEFAPKFNGGMFTVEPRFQDAKLDYNADWRRWGDCYWFQNTRLIYHPMAMAGDTDLMEPLWALYRRPRALAEARSVAWYGSAGSWIPETMTIFGTYANKDYGWNRNGKAPGEVGSPWWRWAWNQSPELIDLLLKRYEWTLDQRFAREELLPQAESLLRYFDTRFRRDDRGRLYIDPAQSAETYWNGVANDLPNLAGLQAVLPRLRALPETLTTPAQRELFARLDRIRPPIPVGERQTKGGKLRVLLPAEKFDDKTNNCENTELYAVWPFACYAVGKPDLELARTTYRVRKFNLPSGWGYDGQAAAMLGLTDEAAHNIIDKTRNSHPAYAWPATWGPNFDWLPDQCHGGNLMTTTQLMLMQCDGDRITLLPAWPPAWAVDFRLRAPGNTTVEATVRGGVVERLVVTPAANRNRVVLAPPFALR